GRRRAVAWAVAGVEVRTARAARRTAAVHARFVSVERAVRAARDLADATRADAAHAVGRARAGEAVRARPARSAAIDVRLIRVAHTVVARGGGADAVRADVRGAVGVRQARAPGGAGRTERAPAVD